jgi:hypothetical protein
MFANTFYFIELYFTEYMIGSTQNTLQKDSEQISSISTGAKKKVLEK